MFAFWFKGFHGLILSSYIHLFLLQVQVFPLCRCLPCNNRCYSQFVGMWAMCSSMYCGWVFLVAGVLEHKWSYFMVLMHAPLAMSWAFSCMTIVLLSSLSVDALLWVHRLQFWQRVWSWCPLCWLRAVDILLSSETLCMLLVDCSFWSTESWFGHCLEFPTTGCNFWQCMLLVSSVLA